MSSLSGLDSENDDEIFNESMVVGRYVEQLIDFFPSFLDKSMVSVSICFSFPFSPVSN